MIGKREIRRMNSGSANCEALVKIDTNFAYLNPDDAANAGLAENDWAKVNSDFGEIHIPIKITNEMMPAL